MKKTIKTQKQLDAIKLDFEGEIVIIGGTIFEPLNLIHRYEKANVILSGNAVISMFGSSKVNVMRESSQVNVMWGSSQVNVMWGSSQVNVMRGSSQVNVMRESSQVNVMRGSSQVNVMWGSSQVNVMRESSQVNVMRESSQVKEMWGSGTLRLLSPNCKVNCFGFNYIFALRNQDVSNIKLNETSQILYFDDFQTKPEIGFYLSNYPVKENNGTLTMFKAVRKTNEEKVFTSDYDRNFTYEIGETKKHGCDESNESSCRKGLHVSDLMFAVNFGRNWSDLSIIEVEVPKEKIVVSKDCDGKVRTSELKVVRELDKSEYEKYL